MEQEYETLWWWGGGGGFGKRKYSKRNQSSVTLSTTYSHTDLIRIEFEPLR